MSTLRGFVSGTLGLIALQVVTSSKGAAATGGAFDTVGNLLRAFLSPGVPAIHFRGHWGTGAASSAGSGAAPVISGGLGPAGPVATTGGLGPPLPQSPVNV